MSREELLGAVIGWVKRGAIALRLVPPASLRTDQFEIHGATSEDVVRILRELKRFKRTPSSRSGKTSARRETSDYP